MDSLVETQFKPNKEEEEEETFSYTMGLSKSILGIFEIIAKAAPCSKLCSRAGLNSQASGESMCSRLLFLRR
ncbi:hypothetical protein CUMW_092360 [Citrus unshiu]|nr:hypothetical protein CUMW_092360 [Citrus unshiu]